MNTTNTVPATDFRVDAIYNPNIPGIYYDVQIDGNTARLRDQHGVIVDALEITDTYFDDGEGNWAADKLIDADGYAVPLSGLVDKTGQSVLFSFRNNNSDMSTGARVSEVSFPANGWRQAVQALKAKQSNWREFVPVGIVSRFPVVVEDSVYKLHNGTYYPVDMPDEVVDICARNMGHDGMRFVFDFGDVNTGKSWNEEFNTTGHIGRSTGTVKTPLLVYNRRAYGGPALLGCIVRILTARGKRVLYQHPNYHSDKPAKFIVTTKHDNGRKHLQVMASDEETARNIVCSAEGCPPSAIIRVKRLS